MAQHKHNFIILAAICEDCGMHCRVIENPSDKQRDREPVTPARDYCECSHMLMNHSMFGEYSCKIATCLCERFNNAAKVEASA